MEWNSFPTSESNNTVTMSTFHAAEAFARYIYPSWVNKVTTATSSSEMNNTNITNAARATNYNTSIYFSQKPVTIPQQYHFVVLVAQDDQMVYIARSSRKNGESGTSNGTIRCGMHTTLNPSRIERILTQHMMIPLQKRHYADAIQELIMGIDFFVLYGPPKFWERVLTNMNKSGRSTSDVLVGWMCTMVVAWMMFMYINWYPLLHRYERYVYHRQFNLFRLNQYHSPKIEMKPLEPTEYALANKLRQRYHIQDSCPICLEKFTFATSSSSSPSPSSTLPASNTKSHSEDHSDNHISHSYGSDHQPLTLLRCGHVYDTSCWIQWTQYQQQQQHQLQYVSFHHSTSYPLKCIICQHSA
jgi:uncharacterized membrane protein YgcG